MTDKYRYQRYEFCSFKIFSVVALTDAATLARLLTQNGTTSFGIYFPRSFDSGI